MNKPLRYHSEQVHTTLENGQLKEKRNIVTIKNGKGSKTVIVRENGKTRKSTHALNSTEKNHIQNGIFVAKLFKKCDDCLMRTKSKSRSRTQKKKKSSSS